MLTFTGYGKIEDVQMGEGLGLGIRTNGPYPRLFPLYFPDRLTRPKKGDVIFISSGEVILSKKEFIMLKVKEWQTFDVKVRSKYLPKRDEAAPEGKNNDGI